MKRTPLRRRAAKPKRRQHPMSAAALAGEPATRRRSAYARRPRDTARMAWVKSQPCAMLQMEAWRLRRQHPDGDRALGLWLGPLDFGRCGGAVEAHHAGERARDRKAPDDTCIPLCYEHHRGERCGITSPGPGSPFSGWPPHAVKAWELAMVAVYQARYQQRTTSGDGSSSY